MLDYVLEFKGEAKKNNNKFVKENSHLIAQNGSGFDTTFALNKLPQWRTVVSSMKNGAGIV